VNFLVGALLKIITLKIQCVEEMLGNYLVHQGLLITYDMQYFSHSIRGIKWNGTEFNGLMKTVFSALILIRSFKNLIYKHVRDNCQYLSILIIKLIVPPYIGRYV